MTPETFYIVLAIIIAITVCAVFKSIFTKPERDLAAQDRDRGLAKLLRARAEVLHTESLERRRVINDKMALKRQEACDDVRDTRESHEG